MLKGDAKLEPQELECYRQYLLFLANISNESRGGGPDALSNQLEIAADSPLDAHFIKPLVDFYMAHHRLENQAASIFHNVAPPYLDSYFDNKLYFAPYIRYFGNLSFYHHVRAYLFSLQEHHDDYDKINHLVVPVSEGAGHSCSVWVISLFDDKKLMRAVYLDARAMLPKIEQLNQLMLLAQSFGYEFAIDKRDNALKSDARYIWQPQLRDEYNDVIIAAKNVYSWMVHHHVDEQNDFKFLDKKSYDRYFIEFRYHLVALLNQQGFDNVVHSLKLAHLFHNPDNLNYLLIKENRQNLALGYGILAFWALLEGFQKGPLLVLLKWASFYIPKLFVTPILAAYPLVSFGLCGLFLCKMLKEIIHKIKIKVDEVKPETPPAQERLPHFQRQKQPVKNLENKIENRHYRDNAQPQYVHKGYVRHIP